MIACDQKGCAKALSTEVAMAAHLIDHGLTPIVAADRARRLVASNGNGNGHAGPALAAPVIRHCRNCGKAGHYARSCGKAPKAKAKTGRRKPPLPRRHPEAIYAKDDAVISSAVSKLRAHLTAQRGRLDEALAALDKAWPSR